jgi:hypothetical protein
MGKFPRRIVSCFTARQTGWCLTRTERLDSPLEEKVVALEIYASHFARSAKETVQTPIGLVGWVKPAMPHANNRKATCLLRLALGSR